MRSNNFNSHANALYHALNFTLPQGSHIDFAFWRDYILRYGSAIYLFEFANELTDDCKAGKLSIDQLRVKATKIKYKRYDEYPKLAELCFKFHIAESGFNKALEIDKQRKDFDFLPDITLDGSEADCNGYVLTKLPIDDPRVYVLGKLTNCCQYVNGASHDCVENGVRSPHAGFYVLLKGNGVVKNPDGRINYDNYQIVGQSYAWLSKNNALVFDSWENMDRVTQSYNC